MIVIIKTQEYRGDHSAEVEYTCTVADDEPVSKLVELADRYRGDTMRATIVLPPVVEGIVNG